MTDPRIEHVAVEPVPLAKELIEEILNLVQPETVATPSSCSLPCAISSSH